MKNIFVIVLAASAMIGCGDTTTPEGLTKYAHGYTKICLDGVKYHKYQGGSSMTALAVAYNTDGSVQLCEAI